MLRNRESNWKSTELHYFLKKKHCNVSSASCSFLIRVACWCWSLPPQLPWRQADWGPEYPEKMNTDTVLVRTYQWCPPSGGYTPAHLGIRAGKWACGHAELHACPALTLSLNSHVKWSSRTPDSCSDRLIKTRPGREDEDRQSSLKRFEERLRSSSTNKRAKREKGKRKGCERIWGWVLKRRSSLCWTETNLHGIKRKAWLMDPSLASLKRPATFIRYRALQYLYHEYFRAPSRSPGVERSHHAASAVARQRKSAALLHHPFLQSTEKWKLTKNLILHVGAKFDVGRQLETGQMLK